MNTEEMIHQLREENAKLRAEVSEKSELASHLTNDNIALKAEVESLRKKLNENCK